MAVPACAALGRQCRELPLILRISQLDEDSPGEQDALATWLLGHTGRIAFGTPFVRRRELLVEAVVRVLMDNASKARALVRTVAPKLRHREGPCEAGCHRALETAIITPKEARDPAQAERLAVVAGRVLNR